MMRCLVVGGTGFLGGAITDALAAAGHEVTVVSRRRTHRPLPDLVRSIAADRFGDLHEIAARQYDWVFDTCAFTPDPVHRLLDAVSDGLKRYVLVSSISAYGTYTKPGLTEDDPVALPTAADFAVAHTLTGDDRASAAAYGASYGPLKRACEIAAVDHVGDRATVLRAGLLVGAGDYTDRLTWWVRRIDQARDEMRRVPAPGPPSRAVQLIDVRDVAVFALRCAEHELGGIWNVTGRPMSFADLLAALIGATDSAAEIVWLDECDILAAGIEPWTEMPLMRPSAPQFRYFLDVDTERARLAGLRCRPLVDTIDRLITWDRTRRDQPLKGGMMIEQERALLQVAAASPSPNETDPTYRH